MPFRTGVGYDSHRLAPGGPMRLGGIDIPFDRHCAGHSDGDAICHAITDALLGAAALGDIGALFPDTDPANKGKDSIAMLQVAVERVHAAGWRVGNVDVTVIAEQPKIGKVRDAMRARLATTLAVDVADVFVKGKTNETLGWIGRGEGIGVIAVATLVAV
ncbi:MAG TPA: 2-C-methyl-D-erythritol 2,4-cyclodiphosphate synthase [Gemmatimonadaceae bacterium]|nr:2-C-methyl-D-erythritol 2,4-cyclodiphosphate synthase [Gemmatimonadaceae bacterium]